MYVTRGMVVAWLVGLADNKIVAADNKIVIPIEVDQQGRTMDFTTDASSNVWAEAQRFCQTHLRTVDETECTENLVAQVALFRKERTKARGELPGLTFTVNTPNEEVRFVHEEGADPGSEAATFCRQHFASIEEQQCVVAMLQNAQRAMEELEAKHGGGGSSKDEM